LLLNTDGAADLLESFGDLLFDERFPQLIFFTFEIEFNLIKYVFFIYLNYVDDLIRQNESLIYTRSFKTFILLKLVNIHMC
jgi:hypothetical protein